MDDLFSRGKVIIAVEGVWMNGLAIHPAYGIDRGFTISHRKSGMRIVSNIESAAVAREIVREIVRLTNWDRGEAELRANNIGNELQVQVGEAVGRIIARSECKPVAPRSLKSRAWRWVKRACFAWRWRAKRRGVGVMVLVFDHRRRRRMAGRGRWR